MAEKKLVDFIFNKLNEDEEFRDAFLAEHYDKGLDFLKDWYEEEENLDGDDIEILKIYYLTIAIEKSGFNRVHNIIGDNFLLCLCPNCVPKVEFKSSSISGPNLSATGFQRLDPVYSLKELKAAGLNVNLATNLYMGHKYSPFKDINLIVEECSANTLYILNDSSIQYFGRSIHINQVGDEVEFRILNTLQLKEDSPLEEFILPYNVKSLPYFLFTRITRKFKIIVPSSIDTFFIPPKSLSVTNPNTILEASKNTKILLSKQCSNEAKEYIKSIIKRV